MKLIVFLLTVTLLPFSVFANDIDNQINKACLRHAVSLVAKLKTEVVGELSQDKSEQALKLATDSCQAYFKSEFKQHPKTLVLDNSEEAKKEDESTTDWLTDKIISGDVKRKKGNERLRKLKR